MRPPHAPPHSTHSCCADARWWHGGATRGAGSDVEFPHSHASGSSEVEVSAQARADLEAATAEEANYLAPYLSDASQDRLDAAQSSTEDVRRAEGAGAPLAVSGADGAKPSPWRLAGDAHPEGKWFYSMLAEFDDM